MTIKCYRDLKIWSVGNEIVLFVYKLTKEFPEYERYGLVSQMRRSAVSIPSNIAEGFNRYQNKEYKRFLYISLGSCAELETQVEISTDLNFMDGKFKKELLDLLSYESKMLSSLIKKLCN